MHAMEWILLEEKLLEERNRNEGLRILHTQSDYREKKVPYRDKKGRSQHYHLDGYFVDAYSSEHAYEFNGCWYHGCPCCFSRDREALHVQGKNIQQCYIETIKKHQQLWGMGFVVHSVWSCDNLREGTSLEMMSSYLGKNANPLHVQRMRKRETTSAPHSPAYSSIPGAPWTSPSPPTLDTISSRYMKCCTGHPTNKSTAVQVGEDFSLSKSTCFSTSRPRPVDI